MAEEWAAVVQADVWVGEDPERNPTADAEAVDRDDKLAVQAHAMHVENCLARN